MLASIAAEIKADPIVVESDSFLAYNNAQNNSVSHNLSGPLQISLYKQSDSEKTGS
jgi:hypothetical protein